MIAAAPGNRLNLVRLTVVIIVSVVFATVATASGVNHWVSSRARYDGDSAGPEYDVTLNAQALQIAGNIMSRVGGTYYVYVPPEEPELLGAINGALRLWAVPAIPLAWGNLHPTWIFSYDTARLAPPGSRVGRVYRIAPQIRLVRTSR